jgi:hypothetical protein
MVNLNDEVKVKLTEAGLAIIRQRDDELNKWVRDNEVSPGALPRFKTTPKADGYYYFQLYELMHIFGPVCVNGNFNPPIEANVIEFTGRD